MGERSDRKSTIVRANLRARVQRGLLAGGGRWVPGLGARLAVRMWFTVPAAPPATARPALAEPGSAVTVRTEGPRPGWFVTESWGASGSGPAVYLLHGWGGWRGQLGAFVAPLVRAGYRVVAVEVPGHGDSHPGYGARSGAMIVFGAALGAAIRHHGPAHAVVAHSIGGAAAAVAVLDGLPVRRLVTIAAPTDPRAVVDIWTAMAGVGPRVQARMPRLIERRVHAPLSQFDIVARAAECEDLPSALVIHDGQDKEVPFGHGARIAAAWPDARLHVTHGLGHRRILRDPDVIREVTGFVSEALVPAEA